MDALHKEGIFHGDLKLENIVLSGDIYDIKLIDFGFSTKYVDENSQVKKVKKFRGSKFFYSASKLSYSASYFD